MDGGFHGKPGVEGWAGRGYPTATKPESGRAWKDLS
jgi:hypothetical protein